GARSRDVACGKIIALKTVENRDGLVIAAVGSDGHDGAASREFRIVIGRFFFGNAQADQTACQTGGGRAGGGAAEDGRERASRDGRPDRGKYTRPECPRPTTRLRRRRCPSPWQRQWRPSFRCLSPREPPLPCRHR